MDEDKTFLDVSVPFDVSFHEIERISTTVTTKKNGKQTQTTFTVPKVGVGHIAVTLDHPKYPKNTVMAKDGALIKQFTHSIPLRSIANGSTGRIYLVSQTKFISKFTFPTEVTAVIAGDARRIKVALVRPKVNPLDVVPFFGLPPSTYHWVGVPDAP